MLEANPQWIIFALKKKKRVHSCKNNHVQIFGDQDWEDLQNSGLEVYASP